MECWSIADVIGRVSDPHKRYSMDGRLDVAPLAAKPTDFQYSNNSILHYSNLYSNTPVPPPLRSPYPFVAPAVSPPRQYLPNATNAISKGKTLTNEPMAIRL